jgi:ATP-dependent Lon protease
VRKFRGQYPLPTYVAEFLLGRYCASVEEEEEIADGMEIVERQLGEKTVRAGEHELFKARAKEKGQVKLIDIITARLDTGTDSFLATLPSLQLKDVRMSEEMVHANERMLTGQCLFRWWLDRISRSGRLTGLNSTSYSLAKHADWTEFHCS